MLQNEKENYAVTRIRTWVASATTKSTNHYTITATGPLWVENAKIKIEKIEIFRPLQLKNRNKSPTVSINFVEPG